jgi:hypothetical protein
MQAGRRSRYGAWCVILFVLVVRRSLLAHAAPPLRVVTVTAGVGNAMG